MRRRRNRARHAVFIFSTPYEKLLNDANRRMQSGDHALKALKEPRAILIQSACLFPVTGKIVTPNGRVKCRPGRQDRSLHDAAFFRQSIELPDFLRSSFVIYVTILFALSDANSIAACPAHYFADPSPLHRTNRASPLRASRAAPRLSRRSCRSIPGCPSLFRPEFPAPHLQYNATRPARRYERLLPRPALVFTLGKR